jgi:hypothetical protein
MHKWHEATSFNGIAMDPVPLFNDDKFKLVINYKKGYEIAGGWVPGCFFIGVSCKASRYGNLFIHEIDHVSTAEDAAKWAWEFTKFPYIGIKELQRIIDTNGNPPGLIKFQHE